MFSLHGDSHLPRVELNFASGLSRTFDLLPHLHGQFAAELRHFIGFFRLTLHGSLAQDAPVGVVGVSASMVVCLR